MWCCLVMRQPAQRRVLDARGGASAAGARVTPACVRRRCVCCIHCTECTQYLRLCSMHVSMAVSLGPHQIADELAAQRHARTLWQSRLHCRRKKYAFQGDQQIHVVCTLSHAWERVSTAQARLPSHSPTCRRSRGRRLLCDACASLCQT